jgi:glutamyl/glutaminyl-tRNA synthetase
MALFRLAPTPSGFLHVGNAISFVRTWRLARQEGARLLLRIDDLDADRKRPAYVEDIFESLRWLGIEWQEGPRDAADFEANWSQRHRLGLYEKLLARLREGGHLFACECSRAQLQQTAAGGLYPGTCSHKQLPFDREGLSWRLRVPAGKTVSFHDASSGPCSLDLSETIGSFVVRRRDGVPAYQVASLADDLHFGVDRIVRGEDLLPSTAAQCYMAELLGETGFLQNRFWHHGLVRDENGRKLSKSEGADSLRAMRAAGLGPESVWELAGEDR